MNLLLQHAMAYATNGLKIFRLSKSKVPLKNTHGHLDATSDLEQVRAWWNVPRPPNIGLACGDWVCLDLDGSGALQSPWGASLAALAAQMGGLPETLMQKTSRGVHLLYRAPDGIVIRTRNEPRAGKGADGIDIKAHGGYIVLAPSISSKGFQYSYLNPRPPAEMPDWLVEWCLTVGHSQKQQRLSNAIEKLGTAPAYLIQSNQRDIGERARSNLISEWSGHEEARLRSALAAIPTTCGYDAFLRIGFALRSLAWERSDGTSIAFDIWEEWCARSEHYNPAGLEAKWEELGRSSRGEVSVGTVYSYAKEHGWKGGVSAEFPVERASADGASPPAACQPQSLSSAATAPESSPASASRIDFSSPTVRSVVFRDTNDSGFPKATTLNAYDAIAALEIKCWHDVFHEKMYIGGELVNQWAGELSDDAVLMVRRLIRERYGFDPGTNHAHDAAMQHVLSTKVDPLKDYLTSLRWDGISRIGSWLLTYLGAADTPLNREIGRLVLVAAVRRARRPGTKFDQILVLEGIEGKGKSTAIEILAGTENFSDAPILGLSSREQQEAMTGMWLYEIADLQGMRKSDVEHIKAFASRKVDSARPAYGRYRVDKPRRCVFIATTNDDSYLKSETGNRRFWPVLTSHVNIAGLIRDRDQLWAEAVAEDDKGASIVLDEKLWQAASEEQEARKEVDPWLEQIEKYVFDQKHPHHDVSLNEVLIDNPHMQMRADQLTSGTLQRVGHCLRKLGFTRYRRRVAAGNLQWRYRLLPHVRPD